MTTSRSLISLIWRSYRPGSVAVLRCSVTLPILSCHVRFPPLRWSFAGHLLTRVAVMGQGAAQAVEDACTLAALLPLGTVAEDVSKRLEVYEKARKERADWVQDFTRKRGRDPSGKDGPVPTRKSGPFFFFLQQGWPG
ncbi:zeaxanthin epoxidase, putative [Macrophomina phaseolina MS6]|uniref:Zeaxanthin epoxidase, putative n=1 Tax=Macrophomina phaseolina (strain MS6) TaxID=1126212 RepID=K2RQM7_MACPH|nr:zeaxanthin epoxidase, putative [Macrophomina phaseolina MS6]